MSYPCKAIQRSSLNYSKFSGEWLLISCRLKNDYTGKELKNIEKENHTKGS